MGAALRRAGLILPDGVGIILAAQLLGYRHRGRVTGPSLMLKVCDWGRHLGYRHFFYGGKPGVASQLAAQLSARYPGMLTVGAHSPPFRELAAEEHRLIVERINACRPDILWVGLGAPKQEKWMARCLGTIDVPVMIGVGAAFDFHSGHVRWAPRCIRRLGIEWAYRFALEPRRMWRRNVDSPLFVAAVLRQRCTQLSVKGGRTADARSPFTDVSE